MVLARGRPQSLLEAAQDPRALVRARAITILGVLSHYNPLFTLVFMVVPITLIAVFGRALLISVVAAGITHGVMALVLSKQAS